MRASRFNRLIESCRKGFQLCFSRAVALIGFRSLPPAITLAGTVLLILDGASDAASH
jgi:hypothetical protein